MGDIFRMEESVTGSVGKNIKTKIFRRVFLLAYAVFFLCIFVYFEGGMCAKERTQKNDRPIFLFRT